MKVLYYDCFAGISGDMNLGALIDLGVDPDYLKSELKKLSFSGYSINISKKAKMGIEGTQVDIKLTSGAFHEKSQKKDFKNLKPGFPDSGKENVIIQTTGVDRNYSQIRTLIDNSSLSKEVKGIAQNIFYRIAVAEAKIHGKPVEEIHFHEVGAVDSIVDIVGAAICFDFLKPDKVISSPVQLGSGFVKCAHGLFPVPAPATAEILKGIPVKTGGVESESTTPTGAAILAALCSDFTSVHEFVPLKIGYGIGHKDFSIPNVLRVFWAESQENTDYLTAQARLLECNIDDMPAERFGYMMDRLFELGADDVFFEPLLMKKNRPAYKLSALVAMNSVNQALEVIFQESTTLGVRILEVEKKMLGRRTELIETTWGGIRVKIGVLKGKDIKAKPEYEDCMKIAKQFHIPYHQVYEEVMHKINLKQE